MSDLETHVFISYVRENSDVVNKLYEYLVSHGVHVWLDHNNIAAGIRWKQAIRRAIKQGCFFIACFSKEYGEREKTYMNEELALAIDELRQQSIDRAWFIPVKLNECTIPDIEIRAGETLQDIQYVNLYQDKTSGLQQLLSVIQVGSVAHLVRADTVTPEAMRDSGADHFSSEFEELKADRMRVINQQGTASTIENRPASFDLKVKRADLKDLHVVNKQSENK